MVGAVEVNSKRQRGERVSLHLRQFAGLVELVEHDVATLQGALRVAHGVVVGGILGHSDEHGGLLHAEVSGLLIEVYLSGRLDAHGIVEEVELVQIHLYNLLFGVVALELDGDHPLHGFLQSAREHVRRRRGVELLGELLSDSGAAAGALVAEQDGFEGHAAERTKVNARVAFETLVFGGYERVDDVLRNLVILGIDAVAGVSEITAHLHAVGRVND